MPGYIGPLQYTEEIPDNVRKSKEQKGVKEKLKSLWEKQQSETTIDASTQGSLSEMNNEVHNCNTEARSTTSTNMTIGYAARFSGFQKSTNLLFGKFY